MKKTFYTLYLKRFLDFNLSCLALIFLSPLIILIVLIQLIFIGWPIFFVQPRVGKDEKIFKLIKFRTMNNERDIEGNLLTDAERKTRIGSFLRKTSLDELPSLLNVLKGDISIIGPRPLLVEYLPLYNVIQRKRHLVRPGLSGLAQINGRNAITWQQKFLFDIDYLNRISLNLDLKIIILTIFKILSLNNKDVDNSSLITMEKFKGNL
jgi:undecaprenyl phosphate N,N'-diacetylbacillosamine 1-phosphate transferase